MDNNRIDDALRQLSNAGGFTFAELLKLLGDLPTEKVDRLRTRLEHNEDYFNLNGEKFILRELFFKDFAFAVTPTEMEIEKGILIPGHRFHTFVFPEVFVSEIELRNGAKKTAKCEYADRLGEIFSYFLLLGSEQIFDFLIAEHPDNMKLREKANASSTVKIQVFDLKDFYAAHNFVPGDALLCRVADYRSGKIDFAYLSGEKRKQSAIKNWCKDFSTALGGVVDGFKDYPDMPEQLRLTFFFGEESKPGSLTNAAASLDEFIRLNADFEIDFSNEYAIFIRKSIEEDDNFATLPPEGVSVSKGESSDFGKMLEEIGAFITPVEVESFIYDMAYLRELDFDAFFARAFGGTQLRFADEAQEAIFHNYIEELWEEISTNYQREEDGEKGRLRNMILDLTEEKLEFLNSLAANDGTADPKTIKKLAGISQQSVMLLQSLNRLDYQISPEASEELEEKIASLADSQDEIINGIS